MKPIIVDMKDMSDSTEVYNSKPNRFLIYTIYIILIILVVAVLWMSLSKIDIIVKSNGIFKGSNAVYEISSGVTGSVKENHVLNGQYIKEGDVLYALNIEELSDTILRYQNELEASKDRIVILSAYEKSLDGGKVELDACTDNPYYDEFIKRRELLYANMSLNKSDTNGQAALYKENVNSLSATIVKDNERIKKLNAVKQCIMAQNNTFDATESFYYSMISSYLASYSYTALQYDNKINDYQRQIDEYDEQIKSAKSKPEPEDQPVSGNAMPTENDSVDVDALKEKRDALITVRDSVKKEKTQAL